LQIKGRTLPFFLFCFLAVNLCFFNTIPEFIKSIK